MRPVVVLFDRVELCLSEALQALRRHPLMTFAAITTIAVALFLAGGLGYAYSRLDVYAKTIPDRFEMRVFLRDEAGMPEITRVAKQMREIPGVSKVEWIPKDKMWEKTKKEYPPQITEGLENPLPQSFKVRVDDLSLSDGVVDQIKKLPEVRPGEAGVQYLKQEQEMINRGLQLIRWIGTVAGGLLSLTGGILIYNAIRLSIVFRRLDIRVMKLVGASRWIINIPFYIEGATQGLIGGVLATFMVKACNDAMLQFVQSINFVAVPPAFPLKDLLTILGGCGIAYGIVCTAIALVVPIKER